MVDAVSELAQKLYNDDGYPGNLYRSDLDQVYESKALDLLEKIGRVTAYKILERRVTY